MSRRGGIYRMSDEVHPSELFGDLFERGSVDARSDYATTSRLGLPPGRYRYQSTEMYNGRRHGSTTAITVQSVSLPVAHRHRSSAGLTSAPRLRSQRVDPNRREYSASITVPEVNNPPTRDSSNTQPANGLALFPSSLTGAEVRGPTWMTLSEAECILAQAFEHEGIPQTGEIEIVDLDADYADLLVRSRTPPNHEEYAGGPIRPVAADGLFIPPHTRPIPATLAAIRSLETRRMAGDESGETCSICMEEKQAGDAVAVLPCGHWFDETCVGAWLRENGTCPMCRAKVQANEQGSVEQGIVHQYDIVRAMVAQSRAGEEHNPLRGYVEELARHHFTFDADRIRRWVSPDSDPRSPTRNRFRGQRLNHRPRLNHHSRAQAAARTRQPSTRNPRREAANFRY